MKGVAGATTARVNWV